MQKVAAAAGAPSPADETSIERFLELYSHAEVYYAYEIVHNIITMPFRDVAARVVFNAARFLLTRMLAAPQMRGISLGSIVFVLAREAESQGAWKLARFAYLKLQTLKVRHAFLYLHALACSFAAVSAEKHALQVDDDDASGESIGCSCLRHGSTRRTLAA